MMLAVVATVSNETESYESQQNNTGYGSLMKVEEMTTRTNETLT